MPSNVELSAQAIADALAPTPSAPSARWRWGTVVSVSNTGTMNVSIGGATVPGIRCAQHVMGAQVGDRVRVLYCGTEAIVDAVRATSDLMTLPTIGDFSQENGTVTLDSTSQAAWLSALDLGNLLHFEEASASNVSVASGAIVDVTASVPVVAGYTRKGVVQTWTSGGSGTALLGAPWISGDTLHVKIRGNNAVSNTTVNWYVMYVRDIT